MLGVAGMVGGDTIEVQHTAGRGAAKRAQKPNGTITSHAPSSPNPPKVGVRSLNIALPNLGSYGSREVNKR